MPTSDPLQALLDSNAWANAALINACEPLPHDQFHRRFDIGPGSLHDTITHILGSTRAWTDMLAGRTPRDRLEASTPRTCAQLRALHDQIAPDLARVATAHPFDQLVSGERAGRTYTFTRGGVIAHVITHAFHHRAQCLNMLRQLGVEKLPRAAVVEWMLFADGQG